ncbi:MAG: glycosyltransferase [Patescibacteria group bacterium]
MGIKLIDIIVPVYNAFEETKKCIESVIQNTQDVPYRLIIFNDASTDSRIKSEFSKYHNGNNIFYYENNKNLGFIKTVNKAFSLSKINDVVILNSDTIVTKHWLSEMKDSVANSDRVATCMPISNEATIYSIQRYTKINLLDNFSIDDIGSVLYKNGLRLNLEIPVGVGFCLYITRNSLNDIGFFDEIFGKGYGEENDFCMKASKKGYKHILCDSAFVYHKGHVSMKEAGILKKDKDDTLLHNEKLLNEKHPDYLPTIHKFLDQNTSTLSEISNNLLLNIIPRSKKQKILYVLHNYNDQNVSGGTELHVKDLCDNFSNDNIVYILYPNNGDIFLIENYKGVVNNYAFPVGEYFNYPKVFDIDYRKTIVHIFDLFPFDIVHIHHTMNLGFDIFSIAKEKNIPIIYTIHDYYSISPAPNLTDTDGNFLGIPMDVDKWNLSLREKFDYNSLNIDLWQRDCFNAISLSDCIVVPSESVKNILLGFYPKLKNIKIIEHGVDTKMKIQNNQPVDVIKNIAFIGHIHYPTKGRDIINESIPLLLKKGYSIYIFGSDKSQLDMDEDINERVHIKGKFNKSEIVNMLFEDHIDIVCLLSTWPETYSYTLTESLLAGIPVIVSNFGALKERVEKLKVGYVLKQYDSKSLVNLVDRVSDDNKQYMVYKNNIQNLKFLSISEMIREYKDVYNDFSRVIHKIDIQLYTLETHSHMFNVIDSNEKLRIALNDTNEERIRLSNTIIKMDNTITEMNKSLKYIHKFRYIYKPIKKILKPSKNN